MSWVAPPKARPTHLRRLRAQSLAFWGRRRRQFLHEHQSAHLRIRRPQRHPDTNLGLPLRDRIRDKPIQTHRCEQDCQPGERRKQQHAELTIGGGTADQFLERLNPVNCQVQLADLITGGSDHRMRLDGGMQQNGHPAIRHGLADKDASQPRMVRVETDSVPLRDGAASKERNPSRRKYAGSLLRSGAGTFSCMETQVTRTARPPSDRS